MPRQTYHAKSGEIEASWHHFDAEGRILAANATLRRWLGVSEEAVLKLQDITSGDTASEETKRSVRRRRVDETTPMAPKTFSKTTQRPPTMPQAP